LNNSRYTTEVSRRSHVSPTAGDDDLRRRRRNDSG
jgi:hypothetical protein